MMDESPAAGVAGCISVCFLTIGRGRGLDFLTGASSLEDGPAALTMLDGMCLTAWVLSAVKVEMGDVFCALLLFG